MVEERYGVHEDEVEIERRRLEMLAEARDPRTRRMLDSTGLSPGWRCWELGAGGGTVSAWLGRRVGPDGTVWSTDVDLQFHRPVLPNVVVEQHDVTRDPVPEAAFDLVHARAVLQHLPERDQVMETLWDALVPDGWLVVEDGAFASFAEQSLPEPYATVHRYVSSGAISEWRDADYGVRLAGRFRDLGAADIDIIGDVWAMRPGEPGGEWWFLALERAIPRLVEAGLVSAEDGEYGVGSGSSPRICHDEHCLDRRARSKTLGIKDLRRQRWNRWIYGTPPPSMMDFPTTISAICGTPSRCSGVSTRFGKASGMSPATPTYCGCPATQIASAASPTPSCPQTGHHRLKTIPTLKCSSAWTHQTTPRCASW